jgi:hypothetical protein
MSAIPQLNIPVVVQTDQVAPGLKKVERAVADSAKRMGDTAKKMAPALGIFGGGQLGTGISTLSNIGGIGGTAAAGIGAIAIPMMALSRMAEEVANSAKGANAALEEFRKSGEQNFAANSAVLRILAGIETNLPSAGKNRLGIAASMAVGAGEGSGIFGDAWNATSGLVSGVANSTAAWYGSMFNSKDELSWGGFMRSLETADLKAELVGANERRAQEIERELLYIDRERGFGGNMSREMLEQIRRQSEYSRQTAGALR